MFAPVRAVAQRCASPCSVVDDARSSVTLTSKNRWRVEMYYDTGKPFLRGAFRKGSTNSSVHWRSRRICRVKNIGELHRGVGPWQPISIRRVQGTGGSVLQTFPVATRPQNRGNDSGGFERPQRDLNPLHAIANLQQNRAFAMTTSSCVNGSSLLL
jgi:hypothetical protein